MVGTRYAVLISGDLADTGFDEFWNDVVLMRQMLLDSGFQDQNIFVLYGNGNDYFDANRPNPMYRPAPAITDFPANTANVTTVFNGLANGDPGNNIPQMMEEDFLFVWTFDHGLDGGGHSFLGLMDGTMEDTDLAALMDQISYNCRAVCMQQCNSGGFIDDLENDNTVILTAARINEFAYRADDLPAQENEVVGGVTYHHGEFNYHLLSALRGQTITGNPVNADMDGNGHVSMLEAFNYIVANDSIAWETTQYSDGNNDIGNYVNVSAITDVYIRDSLSDNGTIPSTGGLSQSPDIIIQKNLVADPQADFGNINVDPGSDKVEIGNNNYLYGRVQNNGPIDSNSTIRFYFAPLTTSCSPNNWEFIGETEIQNVATNGFGVSDAVVWPNVPDPGQIGHFCVIASIRGYDDIHPDPTGINNATDFIQFMRNHNNIAYRNVTFENILPDGYFSAVFQIQGYYGRETQCDIEIDRSQLPPGGSVGIKIRKTMFVQGTSALDNMSERSSRTSYNYHWFYVDGDGVGTLKGLIVPLGDGYQAKIEIVLSGQGESGRVYPLQISQKVNGQTMGTITVLLNSIGLSEAKYIGVRSGHLVHKADCKAVARAKVENITPYNNLVDARVDGFDWAIDCINESFTYKDISTRLALKILKFVNGVSGPEELMAKVEDTLGIGYHLGRYGEARKRGLGLIRPTAESIIVERDRCGGFTSLKQIDDIKGVGKDTFIDLVNSFK